MPPSNEQRSREKRWVLIGHGDGYETRIVTGQKALERAFLELHFGPTRPATECTAAELEQMESMLASFRDEDNWIVNHDLGPVSFDINHEDGSVYVYLLTEEIPDMDSELQEARGEL